MPYQMPYRSRATCAHNVPVLSPIRPHGCAECRRRAGLPALIAVWRGVNVGSVFILDFFLGWSIFGYIIALGWAMRPKLEK